MSGLISDRALKDRASETIQGWAQTGGGGVGKKKEKRQYLGLCPRRGV